MDATPLSLSSGGLTRYTRELHGALTRMFPEDQFHLVSPAVNERRWWLLGLNRALDRLESDLFHGTNFEVPYVPKRPSVLSLHDLSPWMNPAWHHAAQRVRRRTPPLIALGTATLVLTPTEAVRRQAIARFRVPESRICAVPYAAREELRPARGALRNPYFLFLGTLEPRKNIAAIIEAWREVRRQTPVDLLLAGRRRADFQQPDPEPGLTLLGEVPDSELPALYSGAAAFVYPSLYEGFGLPVLEAMQCGAVVITSTDPAISEVAGDAAIRVNARDTRALFEAMLTAAAQPDRMAPLRARAIERARQFSWKRTARLTREVYEEARRRFTSQGAVSGP